MKIHLALAVTVLIAFVSGCVSSSRSRLDIWHDIKATELIERQQLEESKERAVGLNIFILQIRPNKLTELQDIISQTTTLPVKYNAFDAFWANGLASCAGDKNDWQKINKFLSDSQFKTEKSISLYVVENIAEDVIVTETSQPVSILYRSEQSATAGMGFDAGRFTLRITVKPIIGLQQICELDIRPVYKTSPEKNGKSEFVFDAAAMSVQTCPGQFVLLGPGSIKSPSSDMQTIGDIMFWSRSPENVITLYLIACNLIKEPL